MRWGILRPSDLHVLEGFFSRSRCVLRPLGFLGPVPVEDLVARVACALGTLRFMGLSRFVYWGSEGISSVIFVRPDLWWHVPSVAFLLSAVTTLAWIFVTGFPLPLRLVSANFFFLAIFFFVSCRGLVLLSTCGSYLTRYCLHCFGQPRVLAIGHQNSPFYSSPANSVLVVWSSLSFGTFVASEFEHMGRFTWTFV